MWSLIIKEANPGAFTQWLHGSRMEKVEGAWPLETWVWNSVNITFTPLFALKQVKTVEKDFTFCGRRNKATFQGEYITQMAGVCGYCNLLHYLGMVETVSRVPHLHFRISYLIARTH
jgi:hypothetical protein